MTYFWTIEQPLPTGIPTFVQEAYTSVLPYLTEFLVSKHPHRNGVMCPFMPKAIESGDVHFTYFEDNGSDKELQALIKLSIDYYKNRGKEEHGAIIILFSESFDLIRLHQAHIVGKITCIKNEIMLGALYRNSPSPSLHSKNYFPLRTPTPTLVMRDLTPQDLLFLEPGHYGVWTKIKFLTSFIKKFSKKEKKGYTKKQVETAIKLRKKYVQAFAKKAAIATAIPLTICITAYNLYG